MSKQGKRSKTRDSLRRNINNQTPVKESKKGALDDSDSDLFAPATPERKEMVMDEFSISAHSNDSANALHSKGSLIFNNLTPLTDSDQDDVTSDQLNHGDEYSINAEESKSDTPGKLVPSLYLHSTHYQPQSKMFTNYVEKLHKFLYSGRNTFSKIHS